MFTFADVMLRPIEENDLPSLVELRAYPSVWQHLGNIEMVGLDRQRQWYRDLQNDRSRRYYILCNEKTPVLGVVRTDEIDHVNRSIRVGGDILPQFQRKGYGTRMFRLLKKYCFDYLNMNRVWLLVLETNAAALKLYRKAGLLEEGRQRQGIYRDGRYVDYLMMSILQSEYEARRDQE